MPFMDRYTAELRENRPIEYAGVTFHPLKVRDYALYHSARPAMELMMSSLPPRIARMSWFSALKALDDESAKLGGHADFMGSVLRLIAAALKLEPLTDSRSGRLVYPIRPMYQGDGKVAAVQFGMIGDGLLSARDMGNVRMILAAQNGYEVPDDNWNTELLAAQKYTQERRAKDQGIVFDLETLVHSVALGAHVRAGEVWNWPIREFKQTEEAIDRRLNYVVYTLAEAGGRVQFKHGNPCPTWKLNRKSDLPGDFQSVDSLENAAARELLDDKTNKE